jgi:hypothetical protein
VVRTTRGGARSEVSPGEATKELPGSADPQLSRAVRLLVARSDFWCRHGLRRFHVGNRRAPSMGYAPRVESSFKRNLKPAATRAPTAGQLQ